jgi:hypothetical protein
MAANGFAFNRTKNRHPKPHRFCYSGHIAGAFMTVPPLEPGEKRARRPRRFVFAAIAVAVLLAILLGVGLVKSMTAHRALCPPSNLDCDFLPPSAPPATAPPATPPR